MSQTTRLRLDSKPAGLSHCGPVFRDTLAFIVEPVVGASNYAMIGRVRLWIAVGKTRRLNCVQYAHFYS